MGVLGSFFLVLVGGFRVQGLGLLATRCRV